MHGARRHLAEACRGEELADLAVTPEMQRRRLVRCPAIDGQGRIPEVADQAHAVVEVPHASGRDAARAEHAPHLGSGRCRIGDEVEHELGERPVEARIGERERLAGGDLHGDSRIAAPALGDERLRGVDRRDRGGPEAANELGSQRPGAAADVQSGDSRLHRGHIGEGSGERRRIPAHEAIVGLAAHLKRARSMRLAHRAPQSLADGEPDGTCAVLISATRRH